MAAWIGLMLTTGLCWQSAAAQGPARADTLFGHVAGPDSQPIRRAEIRLTTDDGRVMRDMSDSAGRYRFILAPDSALYELSTRAFGYVPFTAVVVRPRGASLIRRDIYLNAIVVPLPRMTVVATNPNEQRRTPGEESARWSSFLSEAYPMDADRLSDIAALIPGVSQAGPQAELSIAGQRANQNRTTVDGAGYAGSSLPSESIRSTGIVVNSYDVARGQFSGGQVVASTIAGTNAWGGALSLRTQGPELTFGAAAATSATNARVTRLGAGGGGPLLRDKLFVYGALDYSRRAARSSGVEFLDAGRLDQLGVSADSVRRLVAIARTLGIPVANEPTRAASDGTRAFLSRLDYSISERHAATLRVDWRSSDTHGDALSQLHLASPSPDLHESGGGALGELSSTWGEWGNQVRLYGSMQRSRGRSAAFVPNAQVLVASASDGSAGDSFLGFGSSGSSRNSGESFLEFSDDLVRQPAEGAHRLELGILLQQRRAFQGALTSNNGAFLFNSLEDFALGRPAEFAREVGRSGDSSLEQRTTGLYLGDRWTPNPQFDLVFGTRLDATGYSDRVLAPWPTTLAPSARSRPPSELVMSPRVGFTLEAAGEGRWTIDGGLGSFVGTQRPANLLPAWTETGMSTASLVCIGAAAPAPRWSSYVTDPSTIPDSCADGFAGLSQLGSRMALFSPDFGAPRTWRASLGGSWRLSPRWGVWLNGLLVVGTHLPSVRDANFSGLPQFTLGAEEDRPVFAVPSEIDSLSGLVNATASRLDPRFDALQIFGSNARSRTTIVSTQFVGAIRSVALAFYYTRTDARTWANGLPNSENPFATTGGDPNRNDWAASPTIPRHLFQLLATRRFGKRLSLGAIGRLSSGLPYTPMVNGDVNGDGYANDRAFIFDPAASTSSAVARPMATLLDGKGSTADCLRRQLGSIAGVGSCRTAWTPSLDLRAQIIALGNINTRRMIITLTAANVPAGLDYLFHGKGGLRGWGQYPAPDPELLRVRGFDAQRHAFEYVVNPRFGQPLERGAFWQPFRLIVQGRVTVGDDPAYQPMLRAVELGGGMTKDRILVSLATRIRNIPATLLALDAKDSLALSLTLAQRARLQRASATLEPQLSVVLDSLATLLITRGPMTALRRARMRDNAAKARALVNEGIQAVKSVVTSAQWEMVPHWLLTDPEPAALLRPEGQMTAPSITP